MSEKAKLEIGSTGRRFGFNSYEQAIKNRDIAYEEEAKMAIPKEKSMIFRGILAHQKLIEASEELMLPTSTQNVEMGPVVDGDMTEEAFVGVEGQNAEKQIESEGEIIEVSESEPSDAVIENESSEAVGELANAIEVIRTKKFEEREADITERVEGLRQIAQELNDLKVEFAESGNLGIEDKISEWEDYFLAEYYNLEGLYGNEIDPRVLDGLLNLASDSPSIVEKTEAIAVDDEAAPEVVVKSPAEDLNESIAPKPEPEIEPKAEVKVDSIEADVREALEAYPRAIVSLMNKASNALHYMGDNDIYQDKLNELNDNIEGARVGFSEISDSDPEDFEKILKTLDYIESVARGENAPIVLGEANQVIEQEPDPEVVELSQESSSELKAKESQVAEKLEGFFINRAIEHTKILKDLDDYINSCGEKVFLNQNEYNKALTGYHDRRVHILESLNKASKIDQEVKNDNLTVVEAAIEELDRRFMRKVRPVFSKNENLILNIAKRFKKTEAGNADIKEAELPLPDRLDGQSYKEYAKRIEKYKDATNRKVLSKVLHN